MSVVCDGAQQESQILNLQGELKNKIQALGDKINPIRLQQPRGKSEVKESSCQVIENLKTVISLVDDISETIRI